MPVTTIILHKSAITGISVPNSLFAFSLSNYLRKHKIIILNSFQPLIIFILIFVLYSLVINFVILIDQYNFFSLIFYAVILFQFFFIGKNIQFLTQFIFLIKSNFKLKEYIFFVFVLFFFNINITYIRR